MRNFRKTVAALSAVAIMFSLVASTAFAGTFGDVSADAYYFDAVESLVDLGIVDSSKLEYSPVRQLQRDEAAKLITESAGLTADVPAVGHFMDVPTTLWSFEPVEVAYAHGVVNGYSDADGNLTGYFGPANTVTRAEFAKMVVEAFGLTCDLPGTPTFSDVSDTSTWYYGYVEVAACNGIVNGYSNGMFGANDQINRADGAVMIHRALGGPIVVPPDEVVGDVTLSLGNTPAESTIPKNAVRVPFLVMDADGMGTLNSLTFERFGAGSPGDFANVYLYDGDTRLTTGRTVNSSTHRVTFTGLNYVVDGSQELTLVADMSGTGSSVDGFRLYDVTSASNVSWGSVEGNLMTISSATVGSVTISKTGTLTNPKVGEKDVKVAEFRIDAGSSEAVDLYSISLYQVGSISRSDLTNFVLTQGGVEVATAAEINAKDSAVLVFDTPFMMDKGDSRTFELWADIGSGARGTDNIKLYLDNAADLLAVGSTYGYGVGVTRDDYDNGADDGSDASWTDVEGGQVTISFMGPAVQDFATDMNDVELLRFNIVGQNEIEIRRVEFKLDATGVGLTTAGVPNYTDIKFVDVNTGELIDGPLDVDTGSTNTETFTFTNTWNLTPGEDRVLALTADIENYTPTTDTIKATLIALSSSNVKNLDNNQAVGDIVPSGNIAGNTHNVKAGSASVSIAGTPSIQTYINGSKDLNMTGVIVNAGSGKDVKLTNLSVKATGVSDCLLPTNCVLTVKLFDGTTQIGQTKSLSNLFVASFTNLSLNVPKGTSKTLTIKADLNTLPSPVNVLTTLAINVESATVQDAQGNSITPTGATTTTAPIHFIADKGQISASAGSLVIGESDSRIVVAGSSLETLSRVKFQALNEDLKLSKVPVSVGTAGTEVTNLYLYDGATLVAGPVTPSQVIAGGDYIAQFESIGDKFIIPKNGSKTLTIKGDLAGTTNAVSGTLITATVLDTQDISSVPDAIDDVFFEARGTNSNTVITTIGADFAGNPMLLRKSSMLLENLAISDTRLLGGSQEVYKFRVTPVGGDVSLKQITLTYKENNGATLDGNFVLLDGNTPITTTITPAYGDLDVDPLTPNVISLSFNQEMTFDAAKTFTLKSDVSGAAVGDSIVVYMDSVASQVADTNAAGVSTFNVGWSDLSADLHDELTTDWNNGYLLKNLPLGSSAVSVQ